MRAAALPALFAAAALAALSVGCRSSARIAPLEGGVSAVRAAFSSESAGTPGSVGLCAPNACKPPTVRGALRDRAIEEASGLVVSSVHAGIVYVHNDSGDSARFFALEPSGLLRGTFDLAPAQAIDWEDMARGPCGGPGSCLYLADFGDNREKRPSYVIYRVAEPTSFGPGARQAAAEALPFRYPDGSHNAEALLVHPTTGVVTIVTKVALGASGIYELPMPLTPGVEVTVKKLGELTPLGVSPRITGGDVHPAATGVLLRTYTSVLYYAMGPGQSVASALMGTACTLPAPDEPQGEAVGWLPKGDGYMTVSEGVGASLYEVDCAGEAP